MQDLLHLHLLWLLLGRPLLWRGGFYLFGVLSLGGFLLLLFFFFLVVFFVISRQGGAGHFFLGGLLRLEVLLCPRGEEEVRNLRDLTVKDLTSYKWQPID
jgi:hypothetical protein